MDKEHVESEIERLQKDKLQIETSIVTYEKELAKFELFWKIFNVFILSKTSWWKCSLSAADADFFL